MQYNHRAVFKTARSTAPATCTGNIRPKFHMPMPTLHPAETLLIEGADATAFAHAQFSSPVNSLVTGQWQFSAWLDPQGRVRALFHLARLDDHRYLLLLRGGEAATMVDALRRFVFRSKLSVTTLPPRVLTTGPAMSAYTVEDDAGTVSLGCDTHSMRIGARDADDAWRLPQLRMGWPWLPASTVNTLLPPALSLYRLHAVAIDKGCYPGQEIVARLHFRGGHKRHLHRVRLSQPMHPGDALRSDARDIGCVLDVVATGDGIEALVILNDDIANRVDKEPTLELDDNLAIEFLHTWPA